MLELKVKLPIRIVSELTDDNFVVQQYLSGEWKDVSAIYSSDLEAFAELGRMTVRDTAVIGEME